MPPSGAISAGTAVLMVHFFRMDVHFAFFVGIICGVLFAFVERKLRSFRSSTLGATEAKILDGRLSPGMALFESLLFQFLAVFSFLLLTITVIGPLFALVNNDIPEKLHIAFKFSYFIVPWVGLSILFVSFSTKPKAD